MASASHSSPFFALSFRLLLLLFFIHQSRSCPKSIYFNCTDHAYNKGETSLEFPFTTDDQPECGQCVLKCDEHGHTMINCVGLENPEEKYLRALDINPSDLTIVAANPHGKQVPDDLKKDLCLHSSLGFSTTQLVSFTVTLLEEEFETYIRCPSYPKWGSNNYNVCENGEYVYGPYELGHLPGSPPPPYSCFNIQVPKSSSYEETHFTINYNISDECKRCQRGRCYINSYGEVSCEHRPRVKTMSKTTPTPQPGSSASGPQNVSTATSFTSPYPPTTSLIAARTLVASVGEAPAAAPPSETPVASVGEAQSGYGLLLSVIIFSVSSGLTVIILVIVVYWQRRKFKGSSVLISRNEFIRENKNFETVLENYAHLTPKRYTHSNIKKMTYSFKEKLGEGGFGGVYKGKLLDGRLVAVKLLKNSKGHGEGFINEVASIGRTNHINIVTLLGFCYERNKRALVYEYMANGSLEKFMHGGANNGQSLPIETLFQIVLGIARGLEYLHRGCKTRILHFDIKPHNILLDEEFCPKISDFGLAKLTPQDKQSKISMSGARGTIGYIAPEVFCRTFGDVSHKSDVYSYGMMVLEVIGSRRRGNSQVENSSELYFPQYVYKQLEHGEEIEADITMDENEKQLKRKMIAVSLWCIQPIPSSRPSMSTVVQMLEGSPESIDIPPMPTCSSPPRIEWDPSTSSTTTT